MLRRLYYFVNSITLYRLFVSPILLLILILGQWDLFRWLLFFSFLTDAIDGLLARRFHVATVFGARVDSLADDLTVLVGGIAAVYTQPLFFYQNIFSLIALATLYAGQQVLALARFGRSSCFHTYLAKMAAVFQAAFLIFIMFTNEPSKLLFNLAVILTAVDLIEEVLLALLVDKWQTDVKGLYWFFKEKHSRHHTKS